MLAVLVGFVMGSFVGSYLNVCAHRLPRNQSVISPPSRCCACGGRLLWHDNLPFWGYLALRGRCRWCGTAFSPRYLLVELGAGLLSAAAVAYAIGPGLEQSVWVSRQLPVQLDPVLGAGLIATSLLVVGWIALVATLVDLAHMIIPDEVTMPLVVLAPGFALAAGVMPEHGWQTLGLLGGGRLDQLGPRLLLICVVLLVALVASLPLMEAATRRFPLPGSEPWRDQDRRALRLQTGWFAAGILIWTLAAWWLFGLSAGWAKLSGMLLAQAVLGSLAGWWSLYGIGLLGTVVFRKEAMGFGDLKLLAPLGALLGPIGVAWTIALASLMGAVVGLPRYLRGRSEIPFGPWLALGAVLAYALSDRLTALVLGPLGP